MSKQQYNLKTNNTRFLKLVAKNIICPALKTYADTVLFYYLGYLATSNTLGDIVEIGVGGSTHPLIELAETNGKIFFIIVGITNNMCRLHIIFGIIILYYYIFKFQLRIILIILNTKYSIKWVMCGII